MTDTTALATPPEPTPPTPDGELPPSSRGTQRAALADLLRLSRECSTGEAELEARHRKAVSEGGALYERQTRDFAYRLEAVRRQIDERVAEKHAAIARESATTMAAATETRNQRRAKADAEIQNLRREIKKRFDHAAWLADSVLEAAQLQADQELRKDADRHGEVSDATAAIEAESARLIVSYGLQPEPVPDSTLAIDDLKTNADAELQRRRAETEALFARLRGKRLARMFVGAWPILLVVIACAIAAAVVQLRRPDPTVIEGRTLAYAVGGTFVGVIVVGILVKMLLNRAIAGIYAPLRVAIADTRRASEAVHHNATEARNGAVLLAGKHRDREVARAKDQLTPLQQQAQKKFDDAVRAIDAQFEKSAAEAAGDRARGEAETAEYRQRQLDEAAARLEAEQERLRQQHGSSAASLEASYAQRRTQLARRWHEGLQRIQAPIGQQQSDAARVLDWRALARDWLPAKAFPESMGFVALTIDLKQISAGIPRDPAFDVSLADRFTVPALLAFPREASVLIQTDPVGREAGLRALQMTMAKLLVSLPPGRARFTILDPVGLGQSFAGFMHLADHDDQLVGGRIWTTPEQIETRLTDLTEHMETVIQKYLRNEFLTIDEYNHQAGELAEPYRFLVVADFPSGFEGESWRRLLSIARTGARCGVYTLILRDVRQPLPPEMMIEDLESVAANIVHTDGRFIWRDEVYGQFPLTLDAPPDEETLTDLVNKVGRAAKEANRVEVDFDAIAPKADEFWTRSAAGELAVPVGRSGATRLQYFRCGKGVAQHTLVAGKTGSGKSTLLHAMITNLAMWYSPDEVEFYLIDFKKGVEFKTYADYKLPHARAIAVESDREFGLSVLQRIDAELSRRGELFRRSGVQDLAAYRQSGGAQVMPRVMLIIDEFQEFFTEDDKLAQDAQLLLDRLVRQGRAFGIHVFLGSQTIGGAGGLARTTIGQMAIRVALQTSEADSQLILGDNNSAARLLSRPGEAIYNDGGGAVENNSPFQVAWLPDKKRELYLARVNEMIETKGVRRPVVHPIVFEGNAPADITKNNPLERELRTPTKTLAPRGWIGDPVAIKDPTSVVFRRQSGSNVLIVGQQDEQALSTLLSIALSVAAQSPEATFVALDGTPADSQFAGVMTDVLSALPQETKVVDFRGTDDAVAQFAEELVRRQADTDTTHPVRLLIINGLQRYRSLRKGEDEFSFSLSDEPKKASPAKQLVDLIREGPNYGIHVAVWCDTLASIERTFDRGVLREFDYRVLFQMSANDSSNLIDSPAANKLGFFRALAYSEEQGSMEKFRPYGLPPKEWLRSFAEQLRARR